MLGSDARLSWNDPGINVIHIGCSTVGEQLTNIEANICLGPYHVSFVASVPVLLPQWQMAIKKQFLSLPTLRIPPLPE